MGNFKYFARIAGVLFIVCTVTALLLGAVNGLTKDKIAENNIKTMNDTISSIFEGDIMIIEANITENVDSSVKAVYEVSENDEHIGYAVNVAPLGFKGEIEMIVGIDANGKCKSVRVISLSETPGLGSKVQDESFLSQFEGGNGGYVVKENVQPIASATISSNAVTEGVNAAMAACNTIKGGNGR